MSCASILCSISFPPLSHTGGAAGSRSADISINIDSAWFPVHAALRPGQNALDSAAKAYVRYKFYDKGRSSVRSKSFSILLSNE